MSSYRYFKIHTCTLYGLDGVIVEMEVSILPGLSSFEIVGLGDCSIRESRNRVHAAIKNNGYQFPSGRITVSLAPGFIRKEGTAFDLPLAIAILGATRQIKIYKGKVCLFGEMSLSGAIKGVPGVINRIITSHQDGINKIIIPQENIAEGIIIKDAKVYAVTSLDECIKLLESNFSESDKIVINSETTKTENYEGLNDIDFSNIIGQPNAIRAAEIAVSGRHNLMMYGSPGCGKTTLAKALQGIIPDPDEQEIIEVAKIYSSSGLINKNEFNLNKRPFRAPHHSCSTIAIAGGGYHPNPGEISLAHSGVLFLDEINEFSPNVIDILRQPIEDHKIRIIRNKYNVLYPADFILVGAMNPCRCGNLLERDINNPCKCTQVSIKKHLSTISGPILDRIDIHIQLQRVNSKLLGESIKQVNKKTSNGIKENVKRAWDKQFNRCIRHNTKPLLNSRIHSSLLYEVFEITENVNKFAIDCGERFQLSVRGYQKLIRVARSIADYDDCTNLEIKHIAQALQYRRRLNE